MAMGLEEGLETAATPQENGVRAFDEQGRQVVVPREEWRTQVLPGMLQESWDNADQLYMVIMNSLNDGFVAEVTEASAHLHEIDPIPGRGVCMLGIVMMQTGRMDEAKALFEAFPEKHGEDGSVLVNLAKIYAEQGDLEKASATLWRALEVEPNHDNGLGWYASMAQEKGGDPAAREVLEKIAAMPRSWRAQLWLARGELNAGNLAAAKSFYVEALERAPKPVPPDMMMQMSGDLGAKGHLNELIEFTGPNFVPEWHGMPVGNNLIKALVDTSRLDDADHVKTVLAAANRPDWREALAFWDTEITRRRTEANAIPAQQMQIGMLRVDGPIWLAPGSPARQLFTAKSAAAPKVTFLGGTAEAPEAPGDDAAQRADLLGRMTRSLPMYFAEQVEMRTAAAGRAMVPWAVAPMSGFVVSGQRWPDETAVQAVQVPENLSDYVVSTHIDAEVEPWTAMLAFIRVSDGTRIGELEREFDVAAPEKGLALLADEVVELLSVLGPASSSAAYEVPKSDADFTSYLLRLEQVLAVRCASMDGVSPNFLNGAEEILEGALTLCQAEPKNLPVRLLLAGAVQGLETLKPEAVAAFAERIQKLNDEHPLAM